MYNDTFARAVILWLKIIIVQRSHTGDYSLKRASE